MEMAFSVITLFGMGYAAYRGFKWLFRAGQSQTRRDRILTPHDLKALEESAAKLMSDLRTLTDECVGRIEAAIAQSERLSIPSGMIHGGIEAVTPLEPVVLTGEVELVENLQKLMTNASR